MTIKEIHQLINTIKKELREEIWNKSNIDIDNHTSNATAISENSEATFDEAEAINENSESMLDLADYAAGLEARIEELEGKVNG